jgi:hypothetical protein
MEEMGRGLKRPGPDVGCRAIEEDIVDYLFLKC